MMDLTRWGAAWESIIEESRAPGAARATLQRVRVPGGWLCRTFVIEHAIGGPGRPGQELLSVAMAYVPDPPAR
jgi:hypothetical protein